MKKDTGEKKEEKRRWDRVKPEIVASYLDKLKLDASGDLKERAERLQEHFMAGAGERLLCQIKTGGCGFRTPAEIPECAFCGDKDVDAAIAARPEPQAPPKIVKSEKNKKKVEAEKAPPKEEQAPAKGDASETAIVKEGGAEITAGERELDEAVARINEIRRRELENYWDLGHELIVVYDRKLHEQRRDPATGAPMYKNFGQFLQREFGFSDVHCFRMMDVAREFDRPLAIELGVKKAHLLHSVRVAMDANVKTEPQRKAANEQFARFVERAKSETFVELEKDLLPVIKAAPQLDHGGRRGHGGRPKGRLSQAPAAPAEPEKERVTCAFELGHRTVPLYVHGAKDKRAKKLSDGPHGVERLVNGVLVRYEVRLGADGNLELDVLVRRPD